MGADVAIAVVARENKGCFIVCGCLWMEVSKIEIIGIYLKICDVLGETVRMLKLCIMILLT